MCEDQGGNGQSAMGNGAAADHTPIVDCPLPIATAAESGVSNIILFPGERRYEGLPRAGSFDGGSAA